MYRQCQYKKCIWEVMRTEKFILCTFPNCIEGKPPDSSGEQIFLPIAEPHIIPDDHPP